jgi:type I restriction-modification system DNA methylase subunit
MNIPDRIKKLTETFDYNLESYKKGSYNETQVRREFIDPFFEELGWDVANKQGYAEAYKDVIHEDAIKVGGITKAPDYCFRIGGARKFFLEAKKPSINIQEDIHPAYQLRRYGWSAKLPLSILTDFEELAVYDCRVKPVKTDKVSHSRILYLKYTDYAARWEEIAGIFSRDAILKGSFDKYVESKKGKKGTTEVDTAFLHEIENWREFLARNIALRNSNLSQRELNFAVQQTIDRIVFLRICEDRGMEPCGGLMALRNGENVYKRLFQLFNKADEKYNSGLFHFRKEKGRENCDNLTPSLQIDDKPLKEIFKNLYYPESPYEFSVLSANILGQVYERFLGKVIRLTAGHQAKIEEKPEVRKAGGVYYTPDYIVDYIVKNTVGKLVEGKKPGPRGGVSHFKILDPACGSGSFLIGAYQFLLDWHRDEYINDGPENWSKGKIPRVYQSRKGEWRLTTDERKRILLNNIYGVDIDHQAVEVTKLSLLLKVLEGEDEQSIGKQMLMFQERVLPDLSKNIKCGNSLIGPDFYDNRQIHIFDEEEIYRVNAFDWNAEFAEIMKDGGFDAVIGNPPYGAEFTESMTAYFKNVFLTHVWRGESYLLFVEQAFKRLRTDGLFSFIIPDTYLNLGFTQSLRTFLLQNAKLREIVLLPSNVFPGATVDTTVLVAQKAENTTSFHNSSVNVNVFNKKTAISAVENPDRSFEINTGYWHQENAFNVRSNRKEIDLISKIGRKYKSISEFANMFSGVKCYEVGKGTPRQTKTIRDEKPFTSNKKQSDNWSPFFDGKHIGRYEVLWKENNWIDYGPWLAAPRESSNFEGEKILIRKIISKTLIATYAPTTSYCNTLLFVLKLKHELQFSYQYILGILNSHFIGWYFRKKFQIAEDDTFPQIMIRDILQFPLPIVAKSAHDQMLTLVDQMLDLNKRLAESKMPQTTEMLRRQIEATDKQIDDLVYKLYDLTDEEIKIVESES